MTATASLQNSTVSLRVTSALFEIQAGEPTRTSRQVLWTICALLGVLVVWACFAKLDIVAVASGRLVPETYVKIVQPAEAGVVREILVDEGDAVEEGQVLIRLDPTVNRVDSVAVGRELALNRLDLRRLQAELDGTLLVHNSADDPILFGQVAAQFEARRRMQVGAIAQEVAAGERARRELDASREVLEKLEATLPTYEQTAAAYDDLAARKLVGALEAVERRRQVIEQAQDVEAQTAMVASLEANVRQRDQQLEQIESNYFGELRQAQLAAVTMINRLEQQEARLAYAQDLLELRAPQAGVVKSLATTTLGAVVQPGTVLVDLVPADEPLIAEVRIENQDIGFVERDQDVRIKLAAYEFQKYGVIDGKVRTVSADSSEGISGARAPGDAGREQFSFKALIELDHQRLEASGLNLPLASGMQVTAEIKQGRRTVLEYLLSPIQRVVGEAAMER